LDKKQHIKPDRGRIWFFFTEHKPKSPKNIVLHPEILKITTISPRIPGGMVFQNKKQAPVRNALVFVSMAFYQNPRIPGFESKALSNPKDDVINNNASHFYPMECPKPVSLLKQFEFSRK